MSSSASPSAARFAPPRAPRRVPRPRARRAASRPALASSSNPTPSSSSASSSSSPRSDEALLVSRLRGVSGRGAGASAADERAIADAVTRLEAHGGLARPATRPEIRGTWRLLYTSKSDFDARNPLGARVDGTAPGVEGFFAAIFGREAGARMAQGMGGGGATASASSISQASSSPIQRAVTSLEAFTIQQAIRLECEDPRVDQVVQFGDGNYLRLSASASVGDASASELSEHSERSERSGSNGVGGDGRRIDFAFDLAYFELATGPFGIALPGTKPARVPYPVPFKLLGDEAKGWLDTTYLGEDVRISRGNKGTTFVLVRERSEEEGGVALPYDF